MFILRINHQYRIVNLIPQYAGTLTNSDILDAIPQKIGTICYDKKISMREI